MAIGKKRPLATNQRKPPQSPGGDTLVVQTNSGNQGIARAPSSTGRKGSSSTMTGRKGCANCGK